MRISRISVSREANERSRHVAFGTWQLAIRAVLDRMCSPAVRAFRRVPLAGRKSSPRAEFCAVPTGLRFLIMPTQHRGAGLRFFAPAALTQLPFGSVGQLTSNLEQLRNAKCQMQNAKC